MAQVQPLAAGPTYLYKLLALRQAYHPLFLRRNLSYLKGHRRKATTLLTKRTKHVDGLLEIREKVEALATLRPPNKTLHIELRAVVCKDGVGDGRQQQQQQSQQPIMVDVSLMEVTMAAEGRGESVNLIERHRRLVPVVAADPEDAKTMPVAAIEFGRTCFVNEQQWPTEQRSYLISIKTPLNSVDVHMEGDSLAGRTNEMLVSENKGFIAPATHYHLLLFPDGQARSQYMMSPPTETDLANLPYLRFHLAWTLSATTSLSTKVCPPTLSTVKLSNNSHAKLVNRQHKMLVSSSTVGKIFGGLLYNRSSNGSPNQGSSRGGNTSQMQPLESSNSSRMLDLARRTCFIFHGADNSTIPISEDTCGPVCPWCLQDFYTVDLLLVHLNHSHSRFLFEAKVETQNASITVINVQPNRSHYDATDFYFRPDSNRMLPKNYVLVVGFKPITREFFMETYGNRMLSQRASMSSHGTKRARTSTYRERTFYHSRTYEPITSLEMDEDSEDDLDIDWMQERSMRMLDDFSDVNEGEKNMMKLWNRHTIQYKVIADKFVPQVCREFCERYASDIWSQCIRNNFVLHLMNLYTYRIVSSRDIKECLAIVDAARPPSPSSSSSSKIM